MILETYKKNTIHIYIVSKDFSDDEAEKKIGTFFKEGDASRILTHNADVYTSEGKLLLRFRKHVLPEDNIDSFYTNAIRFAKQRTKARGIASGSTTMNPGTNPAVMTNVMGYFDKWPIVQKHIFKTLGIEPPSKVRVCSFNSTFPEKWNKLIPLIKDIDTMYKKMNPEEHKKQLHLASQTGYRIASTAFTTVTTNVNLQTAYHRDKGDFKQGFGNLVVIERGGTPYVGGYTVFPQYGIGVDVRNCDYLSMDVHELHGNAPIRNMNKDTIRLSIVCYLRKNVYEYSKGTTYADVEHNMNIMKKVTDEYKRIKGGWLGSARKNK